MEVSSGGNKEGRKNGRSEVGDDEGRKEEREKGRLGIYLSDNSLSEGRPRLFEQVCLVGRQHQCPAFVEDHRREASLEVPKRAVLRV